MEPLQKKYESQINDLIEACHRCAELNYVTSCGGNLSIRVEDNLLLITPTKTLKRKMTFDDICVIDLDGNILYAKEGKKPTGEWPFHTRIMKKRPDVKAIVHAHPPYMTGFAIAHSDILTLPILPEPIIEIGPMRNVPYGTPLSEDLSLKFDDVIEESNGFLMQNHGVLFCSPNHIEEAVESLTMAEEMAHSIFVAQVMGGYKTIPDSYVKEMDEVIAVRNLKMPGAEGKFKSATELYGL